MKQLHLGLAGLFSVAAGLASAEAANPGVRNLSDMQFAAMPGFPTCAQASVQHGNPASEPSILLIKLARGCQVPWHWHTPNEYVMMTAGEGRVELKDGGKPTMLRAGGFAEMPSQHVHRVQCTSKACLVYVHADGAPFDIHYVDADGKEIQPDVALKAVKETAATR
jgi:quercetin dioxygenase-like cupin family protein